MAEAARGNAIRSQYEQQIAITSRPKPAASAASAPYANDVEIRQDEHDATLRFYRKHGDTRQQVAFFTVPLSVLAALTRTAIPEVCVARNVHYRCTRPRGHSGLHVAVVGDETTTTWH